MDKRGTKSKRTIQAEQILSNLKSRTQESLPTSIKKIKKQKRKQTSSRQSSTSVVNGPVLTYIDQDNQIKNVQFIFKGQRSQLLETEQSFEEDIKISEVFLRTYRELLEKNLLSDDMNDNSMRENIAGSQSEWEPESGYMGGFEFNLEKGFIEADESAACDQVEAHPVV